MSSPRLRIVPSFNDDSSGNGFATPTDGCEVISGASVLASLALYFEWEDHRSAIMCRKDNAVQPIHCVVDYDRDERNPTELRVLFKIEATSSSKIEAFSSVLIRLEVFGTCFQFEATITATSDNPHEDGWSLIVSMPKEIQLRRTRRLPRYCIEQKTETKMPRVSWQLEGETSKSSDVPVIEIGIRSLSVHSTEPLRQGKGILTIGGKLFAAELIRVITNKYSFTLRFQKIEDFGTYFDIYRTFAYPSLRFRGELPYEAGMALYEKSNYFDKLNGKTPEQKKAIEVDWKAIDTGLHVTSADYYAVDEDGHAVASAGLALCNFIEERSVWSFHQLCALKRSDLVDLTGDLHRWRVEYLAARPEDLVGVVWFNSKSRWVERMYAKHANASLLGSKIYPILDRRCKFQKGNIVGNHFDLRAYNVGDARRVSTANPKMWGAVGPRYLNANENLDTIVVLDPSTTTDDISKLAAELIAAIGAEELSILVTVPAEYDVAPLGGDHQNSDRFGYFPKADLVNLLYSMEHSIAVTERKLAIA